jgi:hypothetical protein
VHMQMDKIRHVFSLSVAARRDPVVQEL